MDKLKNPDVAAIVAVALALLVELASYLETHESVLELLPAWVGPLLLGGAALARFVLSSRKASHAEHIEAVEAEAARFRAERRSQVDTEPALGGEEPSL